MKTRSSPCEGRQREDYFATRNPGRSSPYRHSSSSWQVGEAQFGESMSWKLLAGRFQIKDIKVLTLLHCISQHHVVAFQKNGVSFEDCLLFSTAMDSKRVVAWECLVWWSYGHGVLGLQWKLTITKLFRLILLPKWIGAVWRFFVKMSLFRDSKMWNHFRWWGKCF